MNILKSVPDSETNTEKARRWSAFVCPDCRFVFRVPRDHDGVGIICPSCRRMLRIPGEGDAAPPLIASLQKGNLSVEESSQDVQEKGRKKRKRKGKDGGTPHRDGRVGRRKTARSRKNSRKGILLAGIMVMIAATVVAMFYREPSTNEVDISDWQIPGEGQDAESPSVPLLLPEEDLDDSEVDEAERE